MGVVSSPNSVHDPNPTYKTQIRPTPTPRFVAVQALDTVAVQSRAFPSDPVLAASARVVLEMSTRHAGLLLDARAALDNHSFLEARQKVLASLCT